MFSEKIIKILGIAATAIGVGASLLNGWVTERKMESVIKEKVNEALSEQDGKEES